MSLFIDNGWLDTEEWERCAPRFCRNCTRKRRNQNRPSLGLPPRIDNRASAAAYIFVIPHPCFRINWFADRAKQAERREIVFCHPIVAPANESADCCRSGIENVDSIFVNNFPETIGLGPIGCALVHNGRRTIRQRNVNDIAVAWQPTDVGGATKNGL